MKQDADIVEFEGSRVSQVVFIVLSILTTFGFWLVFRASEGIVDFAINGFVVLILGMGTYLMIDQYRPRSGPVVTLSPEGIRDVRVAPEVIPWSAVQMIQPQRNIGSRSLVLTVDAGTVERIGGKLEPPPPGVSRPPGPEMIQINGAGLKVKFSALSETCIEFAHRYGHAKVG